MSNAALPPAHEQNSQEPAQSDDAMTHEKPPSQAMAVVALVLCSIFVIPVTVVIGLGLAITVLIRSNPRRNYGVRKAIIAIVIGAFGLALVGGLFAWTWSVMYGTGVERDQNGTVTSGAAAVPEAVRIGDCFNDNNPRDELVLLYRVDIVPCSEPHQWEAYHHFGLADGPWPGDNEVAWLADPWCRTAFHGFIGEREGPSDLQMEFYLPDEASWEVGDRFVMCYVGTGSPTTGSLRGSVWRDTQ